MLSCEFFDTLEVTVREKLSFPGTWDGPIKVQKTYSAST